MKALGFLLLLSLVASAAARSDDNQPTDILPSAEQPVNTTQLAAWLIGGVPSSRLASLVAARGLATLPTRKELRQMESAGANQDLMGVLKSGNAQSARVGPPVPDALLKKTKELAKYLDLSYEYAKTLKPKPTKK